MKLSAFFIAGLLSLFLSLFCFAQISFAETTPFRSAKIVTTDTLGTFYTNLDNCSVTDGQTCDRALSSSYANLYFSEFGSYADFGMPQGSIITKVRVRVTGKSSIRPFALFPGMMLGKQASSFCQRPSDLWTLWNLNSNVITTQDFVTNVMPAGFTRGVNEFCLQPFNFENRMLWRLNATSHVSWTANVDNFEIAFDYEPPAVSAKTPLILIPGIGGSELKTSEETYWLDRDDGHGGKFSNIYPKDEIIWMNEDKAKAFGDDDYFDILKMQVNGVDSEVNLALTGNVVSLAYQDVIDFFTTKGYELNKDFFVFSYDWRKDISLTTPLLGQKIESIIQQTGSEKVDIIAHSMGGLVARNYISNEGQAQKVRKLIDLGTPHLGSVDFLKNLEYGGCLTKPGILTDLAGLNICFGLVPSEVKDVVQNMISAYELAPTQKYFEFYSGEDNDHPFPFADLRDIDDDGVTGKLNYPQIKNLLTNLGHNTGLFGPSEVFHDLDNNLASTNGVEVINIVGSGLPTLGQIIEKYSIDFLGIKIPHKDMININGDKTVPLFSASLIDYGKSLSLLGDAKVFYTNQEHGELVAFGPALNLVKNILNNDTQLPEGVSVVPFAFSGTQVSVHSPVNIHVYDVNGNHTGSTDNGDFEVNIPGSSYDTLDDAKFIFLPDDGVYQINLEATDNGSFDFKIRKYENDSLIEETLFNDIPLTNLTKAEAEIDTLSDQSPILFLDENGDGATDQDINPSSILAGDGLFDQNPPSTEAQLSGVSGNNDWYKSDVIVTLSSQDEEGGSGILETEYSLDNGQTVNIYTEPFVISEEKINKLKFKSIDNAGNEENPKELEIKIDKTPPEAKVVVDKNKKDLSIAGVDANTTKIDFSDNTATKGKDDFFYLITDEAGNTLRMDVEDRDNAKQNRFRVLSLRYNSDVPIVKSRNYFTVIYENKQGKINITKQTFEISNESKVRIQYDGKKNRSTITTKGPKGERLVKTREGLVLLELLTKNGLLETKY